MLEIKETVIDGIKYRYQPMTATPAKKLFIKLSKRYGNMLGEAIKSLGEVADYDLDSTKLEIFANALSPIGTIVQSFIEVLDEEFFEELTTKFFNQVIYKNEAGKEIPLTKDTREILFGGRLLSEIKLLLFCVEAQYSDFFAYFKSLSQKAVVAQAMRNEKKKEKIESSLISLPPLTGPFGDS